MVANEKCDQPGGFLVAGIGRTWWTPFGGFVEAFARLVDALRSAFHLKANGSLGDVSDHGAGMAVRFVGFAGRVVHLDDNRPQMTAVELGQSSARTGRGRRIARRIAPKKSGCSKSESRIAPLTRINGHDRA